MNLLNFGASQTGVFEHSKQSWKMLMSSIEIKTLNLRCIRNDLIPFMLLQPAFNTMK